MQIAELFENEGCQAVRLPEDCRFEGTEVLVKRIGSAVLLVPKDQVWEGFMEGFSSFGDDFMVDRQRSECRRAEKCDISERQT